MSTKQKVKLYVMAVKYSYQKEFDYLICTSDRSDWSHDKSTVYIVLSEVEVEIDTPELNQKQLTLLEVDQLNENIKKEKAASFARVTAIEEKIQSLLCIEAQ